MRLAQEPAWLRRSDNTPSPGPATQASATGKDVISQHTRCPCPRSVHHEGSQRCQGGLLSRTTFGRPEGVTFPGKAS